MLLLDTHIWVWWVNRNIEMIPPLLLQSLEDRDNRKLVSPVSIYELSVLVKKGRIKIKLDLDDWLDIATEKSGIEVCTITYEIAKKAGSLPAIHGDPIDRLLIATAQFHNLQFATKDQWIRKYPDLNSFWD